MFNIYSNLQSILNNLRKIMLTLSSLEYSLFPKAVSPLIYILEICTFQKCK